MAEANKEENNERFGIGDEYKEESANMIPLQDDYNDDSVAANFCKTILNDRGRFCADLGSKWYSWTGTKWRPEASPWILGQTRLYCRFLANNLRKEAEELGGKEGVFLRSKARHLQSGAKHAIVAKLCQNNEATQIDPNDLDSDWSILGTPNGVVELRTGELREARPEDMITLSTSCVVGEPLPEYAEWFSFLEWMTCGDKELEEFWHRSVGSYLCGRAPEEKLWFAYGSGGNGKNTFFDTIRGVMGEYAGQLATTYLMRSQGSEHLTGLARLRGKRFVQASEIPTGMTWDEAALKDLTGETTFQARLMRQDMQDVLRTFDLSISGNTKPRVKVVDPALERRIMVIPFNAVIKPDETDNLLKTRLLENEGEGILRWMVEGTKKYLGVDGYEAGLKIPEVVFHETKKYLQSEDLIMQFIDEHLEVTGAGDVWVAGRELLAEHRTWCDQQGLMMKYSQTKLMQILEERLGRNVTRVKRDGIYGMKGLRIKAEASPI